MYKNNVDLLFARLSSLRSKSVYESPELFWADYINIASRLFSSDRVCILVSENDPIVLTRQKTASFDSINQPVFDFCPDLAAKTVLNMSSRCLINGFAMESSFGHQGATLLAFKLTQFDDKLVFVELLPDQKEQLKEVVIRGRLLADLPSGSQSQKIEYQDDAEHTDSLLPLLSLLPSLYSASTLELSGLKLVNDLVAASTDVDQAVIGWRNGKSISISQISHVERIDRNMELTKLFESALEEAFDQQSDISLSSSDSGLVFFAHEKLQRGLGCEDIVSIIIYDIHDKPLGCLLLVKSSGRLSPQFMNSLSFILSVSSTKFDELYTSSLSFFERSVIYCEDFLSFFLGKEWFLTKVISLFLLVIFLWLVFGSISFRIEATGEINTDKTLVISTSQDGVISEVYSDIGESVSKGDKLIELKKQDLILQLTELEAERQRYITEGDKARAYNNIVDVEIYNARRLQAEAKIKRINLKIKDAVMLAPYDGIVVEGERKNLIGLPVRKGDTLLKIARVEGLYLTLWVDESDAHFIAVGDTGEFSLVSQPLEPIPFTVERIVPMASVQSKGASFQIKAKLDSASQAWWRPGMTGVAKIDKGYEAPYWVFGRKSFNQMNLLLWW